VENILEGRLVERSDDSAALRVGETTLIGRPVGRARGAAPGARAFAAIRAEHLQLAADDRADTASGRLAGPVSAVVYKGKYRDVTVETALGPMTARLWDPEAVAASQAALSWAPRHCVIGLLDE